MTASQPDDTSGSASINAPDSVGAQPLSVGAALREARTRLGLDVTDVASYLKFAPRQIEALEDGDFARLPEMAFVRGFVRSYAKLLQLDPASLLAALPGAAVQPAPLIENTLEEIPFPNIYSTHKSNIIWLAAALAVAIALALFAWLHASTPSVTKAPHVETQALPVALPVSAVQDVDVMKVPQIAAAIVQQAVVLPAKPAAVPAAPQAKPVAASNAPKRSDIIRMVFDEESWVEVKDKDGEALLSQINSRGSEQSVNGKPPFSVVIGRASGVHLYYKGQPVNLKPHTKAEIARLTLE